MPCFFIIFALTFIFCMMFNVFPCQYVHSVPCSVCAFDCIDGFQIRKMYLANFWLEQQSQALKRVSATGRKMMCLRAGYFYTPLARKAIWDSVPQLHVDFVYTFFCLLEHMEDLLLFCFSSTWPCIQGISESSLSLEKLRLMAWYELTQRR